VTIRGGSAYVAIRIALGLALVISPEMPPKGVDFDYQLGGVSTPAPNVGVVVRDRRARPAVGLYNVCYVNGFQTQPGAGQFWRRHRHLLLRNEGRVVVDEAWGEKLLDIRTRQTRRALARIVGRWIERCAADGFEAVEFDNLDSFSRSDGLIKRRQAKKYAARLVRRSHRAGLAAGQKNWAEWDGRSAGFDFAVAEECGRWRECGRYVSHYGRRVFVIEYRRRDFKSTCADLGGRVGIVLRDRELTPNGVHDWC
jgi:Glycoside-hydrolase family GH114